jgi:hypothetical protein
MISIERCRLGFRCTQRWEALEPIPGTSRVRYCSQCQAAVHLIEKESELGELARQGKCVAILQKDADHTANSNATPH